MKTKRFVSISLALCLVLILGQNVAFAFDSDAAAQRYVGTPFLSTKYFFILV